MKRPQTTGNCSILPLWGIEEPGKFLDLDWCESDKLLLNKLTYLTPLDAEIEILANGTENDFLI